MATTTLRRRAAVGAAGLAVALAAGCGGSGASTAKVASTSGLSPKQELTTSIQNLGEQDTLTTTLKLEASKDDLAAIAKASGDNLRPTDQKLLGVLAGATVTVEEKGDKALNAYQAGGQDHPDVAMTVQADGTQLLQLRSVGKTLYARADVAKLLDLAGNPTSVAKLQSQVPANLAWAKKALGGSWISVDQQQLTALGQQLGGGHTPSANQAQKLLTQLQAVVSKDLTVTKGSGDGQLTVSTNLRTFVSDLAAALSTAVPGAGTVTQQLKPTDIPDKQVTAQATIDNDLLSKVTVDLAQFASGKDAQAVGSTKLPLTLTFSPEGDAITAPDNATPVDVMSLLSLFGSMSSMSGTGSTSS